MAHTFKYAEVSDLLISMIQSGALHVGDKAPSLRKLSAKLNLSLTTVMKAYLELEKAGILEARPQSGYYISHNAGRDASPSATSAPSTKPQKVDRFEIYKAFHASAIRKDIIPMNNAVPSPHFTPTKELARIFRRIMTDGENQFRYAAINGLPHLRNQLAYYMLDAGVTLSPEQFIVTSSTTEALNIIIRTITKPGDMVVVESPTFYGYMLLAESLGLYTIEVPTNYATGIDTTVLEEILQKYPVRACILQPNFANPTGALYPDEKKREIVRLMKKYGAIAVEDDIFSNLAHDGKRPRSLLAFDDAGVVMQASSLTKSISPSAPGWICGNGDLTPFMKTKLATSLDTAKPMQSVFAEYLASGHFHRHIAKMRSGYKRQVAAYSGLMREHFPEGTRITQPSGGSLVWVELPSQIHTGELFLKALERNITFAPGSLYSMQDRYNHCMRISCGNPWGTQAERAVIELGKLIKEEIKG